MLYSIYQVECFIMLILITVLGFSRACYQLCSKFNRTRIVDEPGRPPYCAGDMLEEMSSIIHSTTNDSWILEKILVRAIGRKASTEGNGTIFGMGQISYAFQILGNYFVENELFMLLHITGPKRSAADLIIF